MRQLPARPGIPPRFLLLALALHLGLAGWLLWQGKGQAAPRPEPLPVMVSLVSERPAPAARAEPPAPAPQASTPRPAPTPSKPVAAQKPAPARVQTPTSTASPAPTVAAAAPPSAAPSATSQAETGGGQTAAVSAPRFDAAYLHNPKPPYPLLARRRGVEGKVLLKVQVSAAGLAEQVQIAQSSGHDSLDEAALNSVRNWRFVPAQRGDTPVAAAVLVPITFKLEN